MPQVPFALVGHQHCQALAILWSISLRPTIFIRGTSIAVTRGFSIFTGTHDTNKEGRDGVKQQARFVTSIDKKAGAEIDISTTVCRQNMYSRLVGVLNIEPHAVHSLNFAK